MSVCALTLYIIWLNFTIPLQFYIIELQHF